MCVSSFSSGDRNLAVLFAFLFTVAKPDKSDARTEGFLLLCGVESVVARI